MGKIEARYIVIMFLIAVGGFMIIDAIDAFRFDRYALLMGIYLDAPLGIILILLSALIKKIEQNITTWKSFVTTAGIIVGLLVPLTSIALLLLG